VASLDGVTTFYAGDGHALYMGQYGGQLSSITTVEYYGHQTIGTFGGAPALLTGGCTGSSIPCTSGGIYVSTPALPAGSGSALNTAMTGISLAALGAFVVVRSNLIYVGADTTAAGGGLYRYSNPSGQLTGSWSASAFGINGATVKNANDTDVGVHGLAGRTEGSVYALYLTTSATTGNSLYRYDTSYDYSSVQGAGYTLLASAPAGNAFLATFPVPLLPSPSASLTPSATPSSSQSPSQSPSSSSTGSPSSTDTQTGTQTPSPSRTASSTSTQTGSPSSSLTAGASDSSTWTPTNTASHTATGTGSSSVTSSQTASSSRTASPSASGTASSSATATSTMTATSSGTPSSTRTPPMTSTPTSTAVRLPAAPAAANVLVVRSAGSAPSLDEYSTTAGNQVRGGSASAVGSAAPRLISRGDAYRRRWAPVIGASAEDHMASGAYARGDVAANNRSLP
jgi:hypothetical protein